jgi:hypothetical protein
MILSDWHQKILMNIYFFKVLPVLGQSDFLSRSFDILEGIFYQR